LRYEQGAAGGEDFDSDEFDDDEFDEGEEES